MNKTRNCSIDLFRLYCAILVVAIHTSPFIDQNSKLGFIFTQVIPRIAVPFFFIVSGYYYILQLEQGKKCMTSTIWKVFKLYSFWSIIYLTRNFILFVTKDIITLKSITSFIINNLVNYLFYGTEYHLWYFIGLLVSLFVVGISYKFKVQKIITVLSIFLFILGLFGESYYYIGNQIPIISKFINLSFFTTIRRVFLMGFSFFSSGYFVYKLKDKITKKSALIVTCFLVISFLLEIIIVCELHFQRSIVITFFLFPLTIFVLITLLKYPLYNFYSISIKTKSLANYTYFIHPLFIFALGDIGIDLLNITKMIIVLLLCLLTWLILNRVNSKIVKNYIIKL